MAAAILIILATILYLSARSSLIAIRQDDVRDTADSVSQVLEETGTPASAVGNVRRKDVRTVWAIGEVRREDVQVVIRDADGGVLATTPDGGRDAPEIEASNVTYPEVRRDGRYLATTFESKETLRRFVADASHELRTPLTTVLGYLDVLEESGNTDPVVRDRVFRVMREEGGRMARLVEDLLVLARLDGGREMPAELVDLVVLAREAVGNYPDRRIELQAPDGVVPVLADPEALRRVLSNLISNAVKHTPPKKEILVSVCCEDPEAALRVADEGAGIPEDVLPHVFERFYRAESSRAGEGTGLGLAIVRETVEALEGRIEVQSAPGEGSTFTVRLPLSEKLPERERLSEKS